MDRSHPPEHHQSKGFNMTETEAALNFQRLEAVGVGGVGGAGGVLSPSKIHQHIDYQLRRHSQQQQSQHHQHQQQRHSRPQSMYQFSPMSTTPQSPFALGNILVDGGQSSLSSSSQPQPQAQQSQIQSNQINDILDLLQMPIMGMGMESAPPTTTSPNLTPSVTDMPHGTMSGGRLGYSPQLSLDQQFRLSQLQQLQQLQQQIFQQQIALISGQGMMGNTNVSEPQRDPFDMLPTPAPSGELRPQQPPPEFISPLLDMIGVTSPHMGSHTHPLAHSMPSSPTGSSGVSHLMSSPQSVFGGNNNTNTFPTPSVLPPVSLSAPDQIAFSHVHQDIDLDISPLTSPWLRPYQGQQQIQASTPFQNQNQNLHLQQPLQQHQQHQQQHPHQNSHQHHYGSSSSSSSPSPSQGGPQYLPTTISGPTAPTSSSVNTNNKRSASPTSADIESRKKQSPAIRPTIHPLEQQQQQAKRSYRSTGSRSTSSTPQVRAWASSTRQRKGSVSANIALSTSITPNMTMSEVPGDSPSPVDLSMPPPAQPPSKPALMPSSNSGSVPPSPTINPTQHGQLQVTASLPPPPPPSSSSSSTAAATTTRLTPVTPASIMKLGNPGFGANSGIPHGGASAAEGGKTKRTKATMDPTSNSGSGSVQKGKRGSVASVGVSPGLKPIRPVPPGVALSPVLPIAPNTGLSGMGQAPAPAPPPSSSSSAATKSVSIPSYTSTPVVHPQVRKTSHKAAEQKRRDCMKTTFDELRSLLPPIPLSTSNAGEGEEGGAGAGAGGSTSASTNFVATGKPLLPGALPPRGPPKAGGEGPNKGVSKLQLLICGNEYIRTLKARVERRDEEIGRLRKEVRRLRHIVGVMEEGGGGGGGGGGGIGGRMDEMDLLSVVGVVGDSMGVEGLMEQLDLDLDLDRDIDAVERMGGCVGVKDGDGGMGMDGMDDDGMDDDGDE